LEGGNILNKLHEERQVECRGVKSFEGLKGSQRARTWNVKTKKKVFKTRGGVGFWQTPMGSSQNSWVGWERIADKPKEKAQLKAGKKKVEKKRLKKGNRQHNSKTIKDPLIIEELIKGFENISLLSQGRGNL